MKAKLIQVEEWLNTDTSFNLDLQESKIKVIPVFQMLCPGCVYHSIPQALELFKRLPQETVRVLGLHSVFEHHEVMNKEALQVFIKEWRIPFPIGIDCRTPGDWAPKTFRSYQLEGTPSLLVIDHLGNMVLRHFGSIQTEDLISCLINLF